MPLSPMTGADKRSFFGVFIVLLTVFFALSGPALAAPWVSAQDGYRVELPAADCQEIQSVHRSPARGFRCALDGGRRLLSVYVVDADHKDEPWPSLIQATVSGEFNGVGGWEPEVVDLKVDGRLGAAASALIEQPTLPGATVTGPARYSVRVFSDCGRLYFLTAAAFGGLSNDVGLVTSFFNSFHFSEPVGCRFPWARQNFSADSFSVETPGDASLSMLGSIRIYSFEGPGNWTVAVFDADDASWAAEGGSPEAAAVWFFKQQVHSAPIIEQHPCQVEGAAGLCGLIGPSYDFQREALTVLTQGRRVYILTASRPEWSAISDADLARFGASFMLIPGG